MSDEDCGEGCTRHETCRNPRIMGGSFDGRPFLPSEYEPKPPWWVGLLNWRRWLR